MAPNLITVDKNTYESLQQELIELRQTVNRLAKASCSTQFKYSPEQMGLFIEYTPVAIAILDRQMHYLLTSRRWREDYRLGNEEIIGRSHYEIFPELPVHWQEIHQRCLAGAIEKSEEDIWLRADGTNDWVKWEIHPWYENSGEVGGVIIFSEVITARKQAEIALANSEKRLRNIAANVPGAIFQFTNHNGNWRVDYISDFIWELAGITAAEMMQDFSSFFARVHPEDFDSYVASVIEAVENAAPWYYEGRLIKPDGEVIWWQGESTPVRNEQGEVIFCGVLLNITQRKQTEEEFKRLNEQLESRVEERKAALLQTKARFQRLANNLPGMIYEFRLNTDGKMWFSFLSSGCRDLLGIEPDLIRDNAALTFAYVHPEDISGVQQAIAQSAQTLENYEYQWRIITPEGQLKWVKAVARPEPQPEGDILWYGCLVDISDRKQVEQRLEQQAQFLQSIWEGVDYGICVLDVLDDGAEFRYARFNPAILRTSPVPLEPYLGKTIAQALPADMANTYSQHYRKCIQSGKSIFFEDNFVANGQEIWWLLNATPIFNSNSQISQLVVTVTDITERKQAEQERQRFVSLIENSNDFIGFATLEGKPMFLNEAGLQLVGVDDLETVKNLSVIDFVLPEDREDMQQRIIPAVMKNGLWQGEYRLSNFKTGEAIPVDFNIFIVKSPETGEPLCLATITRDIRDRKQAEIKLQQQEQFLRSIYDGIDQLIFVVDVLENGEFRFSGWNLATAKATGLSYAQVIGKAPDELMGSAEAAVLNRRYQSCVDLGISITYEECQNFYNQESWWMTTINPLKDSTGRIYRIVGTTLDITERKRAEDALKESQHFIQRVADSTPNILYIFDLEEQRNIYANQEITTLLGYTKEELQQMGTEILPLITHPDDWEKITNHQQKFLTAQDGDIFELEFRIRQVNGEWCWLYSRETPFNRTAEGKVKQILGVSTDITERKKAEIKLQQQTKNLENTLRELKRTQAQLIQSEKMSSLGNMVAGVAHEINNPVNFIYGNLAPASEYTQDLLHLLELYQKHFPQPPEEIQAEIDAIELDFLKEDLMKLLKSMSVGTERIRDIVRSLRNFSRLDEAEFKLVDIHEGIDSTLMILQNRLKAKSEHPEILVFKEYGQLPLIDCYPGQLNQVFMNLLSNAIDALEESVVSKFQGVTNPQIHICTEVVNSDWVVIRVSDNGKGIPQEILPKLFDPFFTTKEVGKGTGLGLSISYQIVVDKHGGHLSCNSILGHGTEFVIEIPITQSKANK